MRGKKDLRAPGETPRLLRHVVFFFPNRQGCPFNACLISNVNHSLKILFLRLSPIGLFAIFLLVDVAHADVYDHSGNNGSFTDSMLFDQTTGMHGGKPRSE